MRQISVGINNDSHITDRSTLVLSFEFNCLRPAWKYLSLESGAEYPLALNRERGENFVASVQQVDNLVGFKPKPRTRGRRVSHICTTDMRKLNIAVCVQLNLSDAVDRHAFPHWNFSRIVA